MPCEATQDGWDIVESSDKTWSIVEENGIPLQDSCLENPMNIKKAKWYATERWTPQLVGAQYTTGEERRNSSGKNEEVESK